MNRPSVYQQVLGDRFAELDPGLRAYFGPIPVGSSGQGQGVFAVAGSRLRWTRPVWSLLAWRRVLFPEFGRDVPFAVENTPQSDGSLVGERVVDVGRVRRLMVDRMTVERGCLVDRIGSRGGLEVQLAADVEDGELRLTSRRIAWRVAGLRVPLPRVAQVQVHERALPTGQAVDMRLTMPVLGEVFRYAGTFTYAIAATA